jgi:serine/threonine protein kinase
LGSGGYAEVRLASHKISGHKVAIKIYEKYKLIDLQIKQNLVREIKILWKLNHPNIMKLYEAIDTLNTVHLITEYIEGVSLHEYLKGQPDNKIGENDANIIIR